MKKLKLGRSDVDVSAMCLGTDLFGTRRDEPTCYRLLDYFRERGGSFIDTSNLYAAWLPGYHGGESETVIGRWLKARRNRDQMSVATKLGFAYSGSQGGLTSSQIERECEKSLERLQTDRIDVYYSHGDDRATPLAETMEAFHRLVSAGKVRAIGASNLSAWRIAESNLLSELRGWTAYCAVQQRYTYLRPRHNARFGYRVHQVFINENLKDFAQFYGVTLVGYSVLLAGAYTRSPENLPLQFASSDTDARLAALRSVAAETGYTVNQVIFAWMRQSSPAVLPIIAGSTAAQLDENINALQLTLSDAHMSQLDTAGEPDRETGGIPAT
jgi:aryl-alcohol dehydrogenase-like predicted oxidoreductase